MVKIFFVYTLIIILISTGMFRGTTTYVSGQEIKPAFGLPLNILEVGQLESGTDSVPLRFKYEISSTGRYVLARSLEFHDDNAPYETSLYLWELQEDGDNIQYHEPDLVYHFSEPTYPVLAIASSENYVAVEAANEIRVLTLPNLEAVVTIPIEFQLGGHSLRWNPTEDILAILDNQSIVVWDSNDNQIIRRSMPENQLFGGIIATNFGWWQQSFDWDRFRFCTIWLDSCNTYEFADTNGSMSVSHSGEVILSERGHPAAENGIEIGIWAYQGEAEYTLGMLAAETEPPFWYLGSFSTTDKYIFSGIGLIWDWQNQTVVNALDTTELPLWLPDDRYFITHNSFAAPDIELKLYEFGLDEVFDEFILSDLEELAWIYEIANEHELFDIGASAQISRDGRFVLIDLVWVAITISIE